MNQDFCFTIVTIGHSITLQIPHNWFGGTLQKHKFHCIEIHPFFPIADIEASIHIFLTELNCQYFRLEGDLSIILWEWGVGLV